MNVHDNPDKKSGEAENIENIEDIEVTEVVEEETDLIAGGAFDACGDAAYFGGGGPTLI
jgi:hypothetical protein